MKYIKLFDLNSDYSNYIQGEDALLPNVSLVSETTKLHYNPVNKNGIKNYFRFVAVEDSSILVSGLDTSTGESCDPIVNLQYSKDGSTWTQYDFTAIPLSAGETLYMKGNNPNGFSVINMETGTGCACIFGNVLDEGNGTTGKYECHGNIMSLLYGDDFEDKYTIPSQYCFYGLFGLCSGLLTAPELPATTLADMCYYIMFQGCTSLVNAPELPATTLANGCYQYMFGGCTSLTTVHELPATTLTLGCYAAMFIECTSLVNAPELPATTLSDHCYSSMFKNCTSLVNAPALPATTLMEDCYGYMFQGCSKLNNITMLATTISAQQCLSGWVDGVSATGTFTKHKDMTSLQSGKDGIPEGWTVVDYVA